MVGAFCGTDGLGESQSPQLDRPWAEADVKQRLSSLLPKASSHVSAAAPSQLEQKVRPVSRREQNKIINSIERSSAFTSVTDLPAVSGPAAQGPTLQAVFK